MGMFYAAQQAATLTEVKNAKNARPVATIWRQVDAQPHNRWNRSCHLEAQATVPGRHDRSEQARRVQTIGSKPSDAAKWCRLAISLHASDLQG
jgi:hypothetical protein